MLDAALESTAGRDGSVRPPQERFAVDSDSIPSTVVGIESYADSVSMAARIERRSAMQVPAVKRCRDLIAGTLGTLPIDVLGPDQRPSNFSSLLAQPEKDVPRSVTMTRLFEDLLLEKVAWWRVVEFGWHNYPTRVVRLDPRTVTITEDSRVWYSKDGSPQGTSGEWLRDEELIRFDSPNDALLVAGARAIRTCLQLDNAAANLADGIPPVEYFTPAEGADPADDEDIEQMLDDWQAARRTRKSAYIPASLKYNSGGADPRNLQLADARQHAVLEIARTAGVEPEDVGVSVTARVYFNAFDRKQHFIQSTLAGYITAVEDRLSMGDVNPRGHTARINVSALLRADDKTRFEGYQLGLQVGAITPEQIAAAEGNPTVNQPQQPAAPAPAAPQSPPSLRAVEASFDTTTMDASAIPGGTVFAVDMEKREIRGRAVPYGVVGVKNGLKFQFSKDTVHPRDGMKVKLWGLHDKAMASGVVSEWSDTDAGLDVAFKVAKTPEGDRALAQADAGVWDGLSIGPSEGAKYRLENGVYHAVDIPIHEISLTPAPVFTGATVTSVAFDVVNKENHMKCTKCGVVHPEGVTECKAEDVTKFEAEQPGGFDVGAIGEAIANGLKTGFEGLQFPQRETISAAGGGNFEVKEPSPYRFDGLDGEHGFLEDIRAAHFSNDGEAKQRVDTFMEEVFAVTSSNVAALNPVQNRPDLFVPNLQFTRPLWELCSTGVVTDKTQFTIPKFSSTSGLVGAHTEGVEPTPGAYAATSQTVTPAPVSGKVEIVREVWDQGGSPKADAMIWGEMQAAYYEAIEVKIAAMLNALSLTEVNLASAVDAALVNALTNIFVDLQFVRGGNRYTRLALDGMLFKAMVNAADGQGRKLLPVLGPANAQGQTDGGFDRVQLGSQTGRAAWALGATNASNSYLFVPTSVWAWASAPKKFEFEYRVSAIDLAIWGYTASAVLRDTDVKRIDYTTADS